MQAAEAVDSGRILIRPAARHQRFQQRLPRQREIVEYPTFGRVYLVRQSLLTFARIGQVVDAVHV